MDVSEYTPYATAKTKGDLVFLIKSRHLGQKNAETLIGNLMKAYGRLF